MLLNTLQCLSFISLLFAALHTNSILTGNTIKMLYVLGNYVSYNLSRTQELLWYLHNYNAL